MYKTYAHTHTYGLLLQVLAKLGGPHGSGGGNLQQVITALVYSQHGPLVGIKELARSLQVLPVSCAFLLGRHTVRLGCKEHTA